MTMLTRRGFGIGAGAAAMAGLLPASAFAQTYPTQDVHLICAFPPGSGADLIVRWYGERIRPMLGGRNVIVENRVGALGNTAAVHMVRSAPDGHTIFVHGAGGVAANGHLLKNQGFDAAKSVQVAAAINKQPVMFVVAASSPIKSMADLTAHMKKRGEKGTYGTSNPYGKVAGALYMAHEKLNAVEVVYRTAPDSLNDLASGAIDFGAFDNIFAVSQQRAGRVRIIAQSLPERLEAMPEIPTFAEQGVPIRMTAFFSAMVPAATPRPVVEQINKIFNQVTGSPEGKKFLNDAASDPWVATPDEVQALFLQETKDWAEYVKIAKIEPQG